MESQQLPEELQYLIVAFLPSETPSDRSKAHLVLASFCQGVRGSSAPTKNIPGDPATDTLARIFGPKVYTRLQDDEDTEVMAGVSFLTALFQVDWQAAAAILGGDGALDFIMDAVDLQPTSSLLCLEVAHLLGQASGHKSGRSLISALNTQWLEAQSWQTRDAALRSAAAMALVKLSRGALNDSEDTSLASSYNPKEEEIVKLMKSLIINQSDISALPDAVEGLAYLSVDPFIKETLSADSNFLSSLFSLVPRRKKTSDLNYAVLFGIVVVVSNICAYRPRLSEEQAQIAKLKNMTRGAKKSGDSTKDENERLEDATHVKERGDRIIHAGGLDALSAIVAMSDTRGVMTHASKAYLSLVEEKGNRGKVLQSGGAKALTLIIKRAMTPPESSELSKVTALDSPDLEAIQALAKLAITSAPFQVFGPEVGAEYSAIRPFTLLLLHATSTLLQQFETMMALTNMASVSPETASRIARSEGLMNKVELLLLEDHALVRRAATELVCNLIAGSDDVFERYAGLNASGGAKSKLQILLALSDVEDLPTRLAASGALATLTSTPSACNLLYSLQVERHRVLPTLTQLIDPSSLVSSGGDEEDISYASDTGLVHRGIVCAHNFIESISDAKSREDITNEAVRIGLVRALTRAEMGELGGGNLIKDSAARAITDVKNIHF